MPDERLQSSEIISTILMMLFMFSLLFLRGSSAFDRQAVLEKRFEEAVDIREFIIRQIWHAGGLPVGGVEITENVADPLGSVPGLKQVDRLLIDMGNGYISRPHAFYPENPNDRLVLAHQGHNSRNYEDFGLGDTVRLLVGEGYTVVAFLMPGDPPTTGIHNLFPPPEDGFNALRYFVEPVMRTVDMMADQPWELIGMFGISGGGWTTTLAAAINEQIVVSIPVAGSLPTYSFQEGDWEQQLPGLQPVDYLDLYLLAVTNGRWQVQLLNYHDPCCFDYRRYRRIFPYDNLLGSIAAKQGGAWQLVWDDTHQEHLISAFGREVILQTFAEYGQTASPAINTGQSG